MTDENTRVRQSLIVLTIIATGSFFAAQQGWLGPYGMPGDVYHLIILISVLFIGYTVYAFRVLRTSESG